MNSNAANEVRRVVVREGEVTVGIVMVMVVRVELVVEVNVNRLRDPIEVVRSNEVTVWIVAVRTCLRFLS